MVAVLVRRVVARRRMVVVVCALWIGATVAVNIPTRAASPPTPEETAPDLRREVTGERGRWSRTWERPDGTREVELSVVPVHYREEGQWRPIDNTLVADGDGWTNRANSFRTSLPSSLSSPVRVTDGGRWLEFSLSGAAGDGEANGASIIYAGARSGVDVTYDVVGSSLKESLVLAGPSSPRSFSFATATSTGLRLAATSDGGAIVRDLDGAPVFSVAPPFAVDAAGVTGPARLAVSGSTITVAADDAWIDSASRAWPVTIDPTVTLSGVDGIDCTLDQAAPSTSSCSSSTLQAGHDGTNAKHAILNFPDLPDALRYDSEVTEARLRLTPTANSTANATTLGAYRLTEAWTASASWNSRDGTNNWGTVGGTHDTTTDAYVNAAGARAGAGTNLNNVDLYLTGLVADWLAEKNKDGTAIDNHGVVIKRIGTAANVVTFNSTEAASNGPTLRITYKARQGTRGAFTFESRKITDRSSIGVNVANGVAMYRHQDLHLRGRGLDLTVDRFYNSVNVGNWNTGWTMTVGPNVHLELSPDGSATYHGPSNYRVAYIKKTDGTFLTPPGEDATLTDNGNNTWTMKFNTSDEKYEFTLETSNEAYLTAHKDRNNNTITYNYDSANNVLQSATDTYGRTVTFTYGAGTKLTGISDGTRTWSYGYDVNHKLTSYTDPRGQVTTYDYDGAGFLDDITTPEGRVTQLVYSSSRVATLKQVHNNSTGASHDTTFAYTPGTPGTGTTTITDARSNQTKYEWDARDRVTKVTDPLGHTRDRTYTSNSNVDTFMDGAAAVTTLTYDTLTNNLTQILSPASGSGQTGATTSLHYASGKFQPDAVIDPQNNCQAMSYDTLGNLTHVYPGLAPSSGTCTGTEGSNPHYKNNYNSDGTLNWQQAPGGNCTSNPKVRCTSYAYTYAPASPGPPVLQSIVVTHPTPLGAETSEFDGFSRLVKHTDGRGKVTRYTYDNLDRVIEVLYDNTTTCTVGTNCSRYTYDDDGNLTMREDVTGTTNYTFDLLGRLTKKDLPVADGDCSGQGGITYTWDAVGNLATGCDANGTATYHYDQANRLAALAEPGGSCTSTISACTTFGYDANDRRTRTDYPTTNHTVMAADFLPSGQVKRISARPNAITNPGFEANTTGWTGTNATLARSTTRAGSGLAALSVTSLLAGTSTASTATGASGFAVSPSTAYTAWARVRPNTTARSATLTVTWYTNLGVQISVSTATLTEVANDWATPTVTATSPANAAFAAVKVDYASTAASEVHYLDDVLLAKDADRVNDLAYTYNAGTSDRLLRQTLTDNKTSAVTSYGYDARNRLCWTKNASASGSCTSPPTGADRWFYAGTEGDNENRTSQSVGGTTTTYRYNEANQLCWVYTGTSANACGTPPTGSVVPTYDAGGNETAGANGRTATYNPKNQTASVTPSGGSASTMTYADVDSTERTAVGTTSYTNTPQGITQTTVGSNKTFYVHDDTGLAVAQELPSGTKYYYLYDGLGSVVSLIDAGGTSQATYTYDPWGNTTISGTAGAGNPFRYAGGLADQAGLMKFGTRYYDSAVGRWTQLDPSGVDASYVYVGHSPTNGVDPSGQFGIFNIELTDRGNRDECSWVDETGASYNFTSVCRAHDVCYRSAVPAGRATKSGCDRRLLANAKAHCATRSPWLRPQCYNNAYSYYIGVRGSHA